MNAHKSFHHEINCVNASNRYPSKTDGTQTDIPQKPTKRKPISRKKTIKRKKPTGFHS